MNEVKESKFSRCINVRVMRLAGISYEDINEAITIIEKVAFFKPDSGSCVLGGGLKINGQIAVEAFSQGSLGPEESYEKIKSMLGPKYPSLKLEIEWGSMD